MTDDSWLSANQFLQRPRTFKDLGDEFKGVISECFISLKEGLPQLFGCVALPAIAIWTTVVGVRPVVVTEEISPWYYKVDDNPGGCVEKESRRKSELLHLKRRIQMFLVPHRLIHLQKWRLQT